MTAQRSRRAFGALGIVAAPLIVGGFLLLVVGVPSEDAPGREFVAHFTDNVGRFWAGALLTLLGLAAALAFLVGAVRPALRGGDAANGILPALVLAAGAAWSLFTLMGATVTVVTASSAEFFEQFTLEPETTWLALGVSWMVSIYAGLAATIAVAAVSVGARRTGALPRAFSRVGFVVAGLLPIAAVIGIAGIVFALWLLVAGAVVSRSAPSERAVATESAAGLGSPA